MAKDNDSSESDIKSTASTEGGENRTTLSSEEYLNSGLLDSRDSHLDKVHDYHLDQDMGDSSEQVNANLHLGSSEEEDHKSLVSDDGEAGQNSGDMSSQAPFIANSETSIDQQLPQNGAVGTSSTIDQTDNTTNSEILTGTNTSEIQSELTSGSSRSLNGNFDADNDYTFVQGNGFSGGLNDQPINPVDENDAEAPSVSGSITPIASDLSDISDIDGALNSVAEGSVIGSSTGIQASASVSDGASVIYSLVDDAGGLFSIDPSTGVVSVAGSLDAETAGSHQIEVLATASDGTTETQTFTINVDDVDEYDATQVTDIDGTANGLAEDTTAGTSIGITASADDQDVNDSISYSIDDPRFVIDENGVVTVADGAVFNTETEPNISITVTATSTDGSSTSETYGLTVADVDEYDVSAVTDTDASGNTIAEDAGAGASTGITVSATDADVSDSVTYSVDDARFEVAADGTVTVAAGASFDAETEGSIDITVTATSTDGSTSNETFTVNVSDVNEAAVSAVTDTDVSGNTIAEDAGAGASTGITVSAADTDISDSVTYSVDDARFEVAADGTVTVAAGASFDAETEGSIDFTVTATSTDGSTSNETFTVNVSDVNEAAVGPVTDTDTSANKVMENPNLIVNGSFEDGTTAWSVSSGAIEVREASRYGVSGADGENALEIDAEDAIDAVYQDVTTQAEQDYTLSLDVAQREYTEADSNTVGVYWNGELVDTIDPATTHLETYTFTVTGTGGTDKLEFREEDGDNNFFGGVIDNVSLVADLSGQTVGVTALATDSDATDSVSYSIDDSRFEIAADGTITVASGASFDHETEGSIEITITATSTDGSTSQETATIQVEDVMETIMGTAETDTLTGGSSMDRIIGLGGSDTILGGDGDDRIEGGSGWDDLYGGDGDDSIDGGSQDDTIEGGAGNDTIAGGSGTDYAVYSGNQADYEITENDDGSITIVDNRDGTPDGTDTLSNTEYLRFADGDISIEDLFNVDIGAVSDTNAAANTLLETAEAGTQVGITAFAEDPDGDAVTYSLDDDRFEIGNDGSVTVAEHAFFDSQVENSIDLTVTATSADGSESSETFSISVSGDYDNEFTGSMHSGSYDETGSSESHSVNGVGGSDHITTGSGNDRLDGGTADNGSDDINAGDGRDIVFGRDGADNLHGGAGNDVLIGGTDNDTIHGNDGSDLFMYGLGDGSDSMHGGAGGGWTDVIDLGGGPGVTAAGDYGTDWTVTIYSGSIENVDTDGKKLELSDDADGYIDMADGSKIDFSDMEEIRW
ncbi:MAG: cadherin domain-containing protein [Roseibium sp.]